MKGAVTFTDTLYLNAQDNANAVFVIQINGALSTSTYSKVLLINGAQSKNVYWKIEGAVGINNYSIFRGTIVCNNGALGALNTGVTLDGRALTTNGALTTTAMNAVATMIPSNCATLDVSDVTQANDAVLIYPNPFTVYTILRIKDASHINKAELRVYNLIGEQVLNTIITKQSIVLETSECPSGMYFYKVIDNGRTVQSGKLISQ